MAIPVGLAGLTDEQIRALYQAREAGTLPPGAVARNPVQAAQPAVLPTVQPAQPTHNVPVGLAGMSEEQIRALYEAKQAGSLPARQPIQPTHNIPPGLAGMSEGEIKALWRARERGDLPGVEPQINRNFHIGTPATGSPGGNPYAPGPTGTPPAPTNPGPTQPTSPGTPVPPIDGGGTPPTVGTPSPQPALPPGGGLPPGLAGLSEEEIRLLSTLQKGGLIDDQLTPATGVIGSEQSVRAGLQGGLEQVAGGVEGAGEALGAASNLYDPYTDAGAKAAQRQADLSGANGPEAQAAAFAAYRESPEQQFIRDRAMEAIERSAAARGGLGSGNLMIALQEMAAGLASTDYQNFFNRLGNVSDRGMTGVAGKAGLSTREADMIYGGGVEGGRMVQSAGESIGGTRYDAGKAISEAIGNTTSALSQQQDDLGRGLADLQGGFATQLAELISGAGGELSDDQQSMMNMLVQSGLVTSEQISNALTARGGKTSSGSTFDWGPTVEAATGALVDRYSGGSK